MSFFALMRSDGAVRFDADRLDINLWVLPGILGRQNIICDIGLLFIVERDVPTPESIEFELAMPFEAESDGLQDLVPALRSSPQICSLIFGDSEARPELRDQKWFVNDGDRELRLLELKQDSCKAAYALPNHRLTTWKLCTSRSTFSAGELLYLRFRFPVRHAGRAWAWQSGPRRKAHAIADIRVNELRDRPESTNGPDFVQALEITRVNGFVITPARFKAGRVNPDPKYVRTLEGEGWERYINRRLSRSGELFAITYWPRNDVSAKKPFRAFLEVEKRRPTAGRGVALSSLLLVVAYVLLQPIATLSESLLVGIVSSVHAFVVGGVTIGLTLTIWRFIVPLIANGRWRKAGEWVARLERRHFRL